MKVTWKMNRVGTLSVIIALTGMLVPLSEEREGGKKHTKHCQLIKMQADIKGKRY